MCSNCSGDDPRPESFTLFDVSSPKSGERFADAWREKRKRYGTSWNCADIGKALLTRAIQRVLCSKWHERIIGTVDRASFVNLNLGGSSGGNLAKSRNARGAERLIEIRVSRDAIIEVFANCDSDENARNTFGVSERECLSAWEESYAERTKLQRTLGGFRRAERLKSCVAYGAFVAVVAVAVWCAVR